MTDGKLRVNFIALWTALLVAKLWLATSLPLFVDEAFYAWEARFPAWAYSDLPGLTAFIAGIGQAISGNELGLRLPFIALGSAVPWLVVLISRRWFGETVGWWAGLLALLMPLSGLLGVLALPDVALVFSALLCLDAIARLRERLSPAAVMELGLALALGALTHYRFALMIAAGLVGLTLDARGRELLCNPRIWPALLAGLLAWTPLVLWNVQNAGAGVRFQLIDRNPWAFHADAANWIPIQALLVTPVLFWLLCLTLREALLRRKQAVAPSPWPLLAGLSLVAVGGYFLLGFFVDDQRVSFHWPLSGWLALVVAAPVLLPRWGRSGRVLLVASSSLGLFAALAFLVVASVPQWRASMAASRLYPADFAGWPTIVAEIRSRERPGSGAIIASDFELGAQLAFALDRRDIHVLRSPLNEKHGRAEQLRQWQLLLDHFPERSDGSRARLVVDDTATSLKLRLSRSHQYCELFGRLPPPEVIHADHGRKRYLIYALGPRRVAGACVAPALAWIDTPLPNAKSPRQFEVKGWAFKDGAGVARIDVTLDGRVVSQATYGISMPHVRDYWKVSTDRTHPHVGFRAEIDAGAAGAGAHWLGLVIHGADGSVEPWPEQRVRIASP